MKTLPVKNISPSSREWPKQLNQLKDQPKLLYYRGTWDKAIFEKSLAVVGSRRLTAYGQKAIEIIIPPLVANKVSIISGFMYGADSAAHQECLDCGGKTVAVLGGGLDVLYPPENEKLYSDILDSGGIIISEYKPDQQPQLWTFPQRNRIVAGLSSLGIIVIEAGEKSGSLVTAKIAQKLKKPLFCVPGPITSSVSVGTNQLIKEGKAKMVLSANDILGGSVKQKRIKQENPILKLLSTEPLSIDELSALLNKSISELSQELVLLSLEGKIEEKNGKYYLVK
jgi:DNA processing protein